MEEKLLIKTRLRSKKWFINWNVNKAVQHKRVLIGISICNLNSKPFNGGIIKNIDVTDSNKTMGFTCPNEYEIKLLNPNEKTLIWLDGFIPALDGAYILNIDILPKVIENNILVSQWDKYNKCPATPGSNHLYDTFYVKNSTNIILARTNILLTIIAILTLITTIIALIK
jgi:hypothetical protein